MSEEKKDQFVELMKKLEQPEYANRGYSKDSTVTIPGSLFADFVNTVSFVKQTLQSIEKSAEATLSVASHLNEQTAKLTVRLMEAHVANIENGSTISNEELDKEDAVADIQPIQNN
jgi:hypothetical protein